MRLTKWSRRGAVVAVAVVLTLAGSGVAYAAWLSGAAVTSQVNTEKVSVTQQGFEDLGFVFGNASLSTAGSFTVENTGAAAGQFTAALSASAPSDTQLAAALNVTVWRAASSSDCSGGPVNPVTGSWSDTLTIPGGRLAAGESVTFCVRTSGAERSLLASTSGSVTVTPQVTATLKVGGWTASDTASSTQKTEYIWPNAAMIPGDWYTLVNTLSGDCVDVNGGVATDGITVIQWVCKTSGIENQRWQFIPTGDNYYRMSTRASSGVELALEGTDPGDIASVQTVDLTAQNQQWQAQYQGSGHYQLVVRDTGMCLNSPGPTATTEFMQKICDGSAAQQYTAIPDPIVVSAMTCTVQASKGTNVSVTYAWTPAASTEYSWKVGTASGTVPVAGTSFTVTLAAVSGWSQGSYPVTVTDAVNRVRHTGSLSMGPAGKKQLTCG